MTESSSKLVFKLEGKARVEKRLVFFLLKQAGYHWNIRDINPSSDAKINYSVLCIYPSDKEITHWTVDKAIEFNYPIFEDVETLYMLCDFTNNPEKYHKQTPCTDQSEDVPNDVKNQSHYKNQGIEPIEYMRSTFTKEEFRGFLHGNCVKYLARHKDKNGMEDLRKAKVYLEWLISDWEER